MSLIQTIKSAQVQARKNKDSAKATLLTTLIGEAEMIGKNKGNRESTDEEVMNVIQKFIKNINETLKLNISNEQKCVILEEKAILEAYLPVALTTEQIKAEIEKVALTVDKSSKGFKGAVMSHFKQNFNGQYDSQSILTLI